MPNDGGNYVFVGGVPRSGTSIFQKMLDGHSEIYGGPEFDHLPATCKLFSQYVQGIKNKRQVPFYTEEDAIDHFNTLISDFFDSKLNKEGKQIFSEKTPANLLHFSELIRVFPKAKFIWVVRDPRANVYSFRKVASSRKISKSENFIGANIIKDIELMRNYFVAGQKFLSENKERCLIVYYEDLMSRTKEVMLSVCEFLTVDFQEEMLDTERKNDTTDIIEKGADDLKGFVNKDLYEGKVNRSIKDEWRENLSDSAKKLIEHYLSLEHYKVLDRYNLKKGLTFTTKALHLTKELGTKWALKTIKQRTLR